MADQVILKYQGKCVRSIQADGVNVSRVKPGDEIMVPANVAGELLAMNGALVRKGENEIMWVDMSTKPKKRAVKK